MKKTLLGSLLCLTLLALCATGLAADKAHHPQYGATVVPDNVRPMVSPDVQQAIFTNLGSRTDAYDATNGYFVSGINNAFNFQKQDIAIPFKASKNALVMRVSFALQYFGFGVNGATVAIFDDAGFQPGTLLAKRQLSNFDDFGVGCCGLKDWKLATPLAITQGSRYWVVGSTEFPTQDSINTWDFKWDDSPGTFSFQQNDGGWLLLTAASGYAPPAVAVWGAPQ